MIVVNVNNELSRKQVLQANYENEEDVYRQRYYSGDNEQIEQAQKPSLFRINYYKERGHF